MEKIEKDEKRVEENIALAKKIVSILDNKKAENIKVIDVSGLTSLTDVFVIATGTSTTHVRSLADEVDEQLKKESVSPRNIEGKTTGWILLDYYGVVVHVFTRQEREYYNLEHLWADGKVL